MIKVILAEDQTMVLGALAALLQLENNIEVIATAENGEKALELCKILKPDVLITDIEMPLLSGLDLAEHIQKNKLDIKVIILTTFARAGYLQRAIKANANGYLLKDSSCDILVDAINKVYAGRKIFDAELVTEAWQTENPLTDKERIVLKLAFDGLTTEQIAAKIHLSSGTVRNYLSNASSKLHARNRIEAARIARQHGWL